MSGTYNIKLRKRGDDWIATGRISLGPGYSLKAVARISEVAVAKALEAAHRGMRGNIGADGEDQELGWGFFKKIWKAAKKVTKKIARSKVLGKIAKIARNPKFLAAVSMVPGIGPVAAGGLAAAGAAYGGLQAMYAKRRGKPRLAARISRRSAALAKRFGVSAARFNRAQRYGAGLATPTRTLSFLNRGCSVKRRRTRRSRRRPVRMSRGLLRMMPGFTRRMLRA